MSTPLRRRIRHARRWTSYAALVVLITVALLVAVANQLLPMVQRHPQRIAAWLSERVGEPVRFTASRAEWTRSGPRFVFDGLRVGTGAEALDIGRAELKIAMYSGLLPGRPLTELKIRDLALGLEQEADGRWRVVGLPGQATADPLDRLEGFGELQIERARLAIRAPSLALSAQLVRVDARIRVNGSRLRVGVSGWSNTADQPVNAVLDIDRYKGSGLLWVGGDKLQAAHWTSFLSSAGLAASSGTGKLGLWARLRDRRIEQVTVQADLSNVALRSVRPVRTRTGQSRVLAVTVERLRSTARWDATANGWRLRVPVLQVTQGGHASALDHIVIDGGSRYALRGDDIDLAPLAALLSLSDRLPGGLRSFLHDGNPQARLRHVNVAGVRGGALRGSMLVSELRLSPVGQRPGLSGFSGAVQFDQSGGVLRIGRTPVRLHWPIALRQDLDLELDGSLALWRDGNGWTLGSHGLQMRGDDFGAAVRMQLGFQGDGSKPTLDLAADLEPASVETAKKFWILHKMSPGTVKWLDDALVAGNVVDGRIAIGGDLDDWPFRNGSGSFDARARLRDATVKFSDAWPAGTDMSLDLVFDGPGFSLAGTGNLLGNPIPAVSGGIAEFAAGILKLHVQSESQGESLRQLMLASPLEKDYGEHLRNARIQGPVSVAVDLEIPLHPGATGHRVDGTLDMHDGKLADPRWGIAFDSVSGRTRFDRAGFATENLAVTLDKQPAIFNLRVGEHTGERGVAALATLDGRFTAATLIDRAGDLAWLKRWMVGSSAWKIAVRVPIGAGGRSSPPTRLTASSNLAGTALLFPAPLGKPAASSTQLEVQTPLPVQQREVAVRLGSLMRARAQLRKNAPLSAAIAFGDATVPPMPPQGLSVRGNVALLDASAWVAFNSGAASAGGSGSAPLQSAELQAQQLVFLDRSFADTRLNVARGAASTQVSFKGTGIEGSIEVPADAVRPVQGRFDKLYLASAVADADVAAAVVPPPSTSKPQQAAKASASATAATAALSTGSNSADSSQAIADGIAPSSDVQDPGSLPPLRFDIADLRVGAAQLGKAALQTTPINHGMRVDRFQTQAKNLGLNAAGEWVQAGSGGTRTNFRINFTARSLGQMLDALGYADMVQAGPTKATLAGSWPGSPGAFGLSTLSGTLKVDVGSGRLLDVNPGGSGRILGLLSLAEIPRRLSLDFSDFFEKGFAFNTAKGDFSFSDGKARTDNLVIDGPAAEIRITGATGMRDEMYDQRVEVLPKAGGILPAIGLLAAGPAGAAVGAMAQAMFQKPLKQSTRVVYRVTGPWAKPIVKVVEKGPHHGDRNDTTGAEPAGAP